MGGSGRYFSSSKYDNTNLKRAPIELSELAQPSSKRKPIELNDDWFMGTRSKPNHSSNQSNSRNNNYKSEQSLWNRKDDSSRFDDRDRSKQSRYGDENRSNNRNYSSDAKSSHIDKEKLKKNSELRFNEDIDEE